MTYWPSTSWKLALSDGSSKHWIEPSLPFALIGSHSSCQVRVNEPGIPPAAYFVCSFTDVIEIWPLSPFACGPHGAVALGDELMVGETRIEFFRDIDLAATAPISDGVPTLPTGNSSFGEFTGPPGEATVDQGHLDQNIRIVLGCDNTFRSKTLRRRVTILGSQKPSTLRIHDLELADCDHAIITVDGSVWMIDLKFPQGRSQDQWVTRLDRVANPIPIGRITVGLGWIRPTPIISDSGSTILLQPLADTELATSTATTPNQFKDKIRTKLTKKLRKRPILVNRTLKKAAITNPDASTIASPVTKPVTGSPSRITDNEQLANHLTDRLVSFQRSKRTPNRLFAMSAYLVAIGLAGFAVVWLIGKMALTANIEVD